MPYSEFIWTEEIIQHVRDDDITVDEFERIVREAADIDLSRTTGNPCCFGDADDGRYVICVFKYIDELYVDPVTAYEV